MGFCNNVTDGIVRWANDEVGIRDFQISKRRVYEFITSMIGLEAICTLIAASKASMTSTTDSQQFHGIKLIE